MPTEVMVGLFTLAGVALGFTGQWLMERRRIHRTRIGIVRAVLGELRQNAATGIQLLDAGSSATEFSSETWRSARFELGQFLDGPLYDELDFICSTLPAITRYVSENVIMLPGREGEKETRAVEEWLKRVKASIDRLQELPEATGIPFSSV